MSEEQYMDNQPEEGQVDTSLNILYVKPEIKDKLADVAERDLAGELRERYWIRLAEDAGIGQRTWATVEFNMPWRIERQELGRNRNEPGDGFRYVVRGGLDGTKERAEWFEVTEVFEGIEAKNVEAFMRINSGGEASFNFDSDKFLKELNMGRPNRAAQRRAADKVIAAVEKKVNKTSYEGMWRAHGYGTLIVGLPLWFATDPLNPMRVENVIDDFITRVQFGLMPFGRKLKRKTCPFWRIVVVWNVSQQSMREWSHKAKFDLYDDPAYRRMRGLPINFESMTPLLLESMDSEKVDQSKSEWTGVLTRNITAVRSEKKRKMKVVQLPHAVEEWKQRLNENGKIKREKLLVRLKWRAMQLVLEVICFLRVYGLSGLEQWLVVRLSPRRRIAKLAMRRRALRLYRASQRRHDKTKKIGSHGKCGKQ